MKKIILLVSAILMVATSAPAMELAWWATFSFDTCMKQASTPEKIKGCQLKNELAKRKSKEQTVRMKNLLSQL